MSSADAPSEAEPASTRPPVGHPDYEFPKEVHNLLVTAQTSHVALSAMADSKASILMGATFVVFSLAIGQITSDKPTLSLLLLAGFAFLATVFSVFAIRPQLMTPPKVVGPDTNLLFFGQFSGLKEDEFIDNIIDVLRSEEKTYRTMARDLYQNGRVLQVKKYRYLSYAYTTFLVGLTLTGISFIFELILAKN
jgi:hypothetical protein